MTIRLHKSYGSIEAEEREQKTLVTTMVTCEGAK